MTRGYGRCPRTLLQNVLHVRCCVFTDVKTMTHILRHHQQRDNTGLSTLSPLEQLTWPHSDVKLPCGIVPAQNVSSNWLQMKLKYVPLRLLYCRRTARVYSQLNTNTRDLAIQRTRARF